MEWGVFPGGHSVTSFVPQEVRTQPWAGGEAGSRHWAWSRISAWGWARDFQEAQLTLCRAPSPPYSPVILFSADLSGYGRGNNFGNNKNKHLDWCATDYLPSCVGTGITAGGQEGIGYGVYLKWSKCVCCGKKSPWFWCWLNGGWNPKARGRHPCLRTWPCSIHRYFCDQNRALSMN